MQRLLLPYYYLAGMPCPDPTLFAPWTGHNIERKGVKKIKRKERRKVIQTN
jgi:hypothetical protein